MQGLPHISTDSGVNGASPEGSIVDGASPMSLAAGADFADLVRTSISCCAHCPLCYTFGVRGAIESCQAPWLMPHLGTPRCCSHCRRTHVPFNIRHSF